MDKKISTYRLQVSGGDVLQHVYEKLSAGKAVKLRIEGEKVNVFAEIGLIWKKYVYLGYLTKSDEIIYQINKGDIMLSTQVAGFYDDDFGSQLVLNVAIERKVKEKVAKKKE